MNTDDLENLYEPIGRSKELKIFQSILDKKKPALIIVTGEQGMGKSTFLRMAAKLATQQKWIVLSPELSIDLNTTSKDFEQRLNEQLDKFEVTPSREAEKIIGTSIGGQPPERVVSSRQSDPGSKHIKPALRGIELGISSPPVREQTPPNKGTNSEILLPIVQKLKQICPILLQIDGYQPSSQFTSWFTSEFLPDLQKSNTPVVVVVADRPHVIDDLIKLAKATIQLRELSKREVKKHFQRLNTHLVIPINIDEAQLYVDEIIGKPSLLEPLTRVLLLSMTK